MPESFWGEEFTFRDPDGAEIRVRGWGNQYSADFETLDGFSVVQDADTGYFHIATLSEDGSRLVPTDQRAATADPHQLGIPRHIRTARQATREEARRARDELGEQPRWEERRAQRRAQRRARSGIVGDHVGLCLLVRFPDVPGTTTSWIIPVAPFGTRTSSRPTTPARKTVPITWTLPSPSVFALAN